jgi:hypothetical protein
MNPDVKAEWVAALPGASQGRGALRPSDNTRCCLGVLCDLAAAHQVGSWVSRDDGECPDDLVSEHAFADGYGITATMLLPLQVSEWAGVREDYGGRVTRDQAAAVLTADEMSLLTTDFGPRLSWTLPELNDAGISFDKIAALIDRYL